MKTSQPFRLIIVHCVAALLLVSCATPAAAPTIGAATLVPAPATATAAPTGTPVPPTDTPVPPTDTPMPTATPTTMPTATPTSTPTYTSTATLTPTATRTATAKPKPKPTNTFAPVSCISIITSGGQGRVSVTNNYAAVLTLSVADKTFTIPGSTADFYIDVGPGQYVWTAVASGMSTGMGPLVVVSGWNTLLACGKRS